jgi:RHS repeat-associated protein
MDWFAGDSPTIDTLRFTGHEREFLGSLNLENTDYLDYMHARYYDPNLGRFLSVDPGRDWDPGTPQSWNSYAYTRNNPVNAVDPDGRITIWATAGGIHQMGLFLAGMSVSQQLDRMERRWQEFQQHVVLEAGNAKYFDIADAAFEAPDQPPCTHWGQRWAKAMEISNAMLPGKAAPAILPGVGLGTKIAPYTAAELGVPTALNWARTGFGGIVSRGVSFGPMAATKLVTAGTVANFALVTAAWEVGLALGSAVHASWDDGCKH